ncbi:hypothetical protein BV20DRAFT_975957 [Pilatotrama ljubarskyi]|nr:hypothetical protein BV20DRAFT_975957 [Pilatotrama ljubarskyi]
MSLVYERRCLTPSGPPTRTPRCLNVTPRTTSSCGTASSPPHCENQSWPGLLTKRLDDSRHLDDAAGQLLASARSSAPSRSTASEATPALPVPMATVPSSSTPWRAVTFLSTRQSSRRTRGLAAEWCSPNAFAPTIPVHRPRHSSPSCLKISPARPCRPCPPEPRPGPPRLDRVKPTQLVSSPVSAVAT